MNIFTLNKFFKTRNGQIFLVVATLVVATGGIAYQQFIRGGTPAEGPPVVPDKVVEELPDVEVVLENLTIPWDIAFLPEGDMLITERDGTITHLDPASKETATIQIQDIRHVGEGGLLGMALHPNFENNRFLYLYFTSSPEGDSINTVTRYKFEGGQLADELVIVEGIPGETFHNGGRIAFGPDGMLYIATGDARTPSEAQNKSSLAGKILRVEDDGSTPSDNPFGNRVYSYGHRNPQGLTWDESGNLWSTEHGRSGATSGLDELNLIRKGANYGWPESQGDEVAQGTTAPVVHSGPDVTWAPASALYWNGSIFFGGLRGETLYEVPLQGVRAGEVKSHFGGEFGRIRTIVLGPDGMFYITTSNRDGRGDVRAGDDKVIRINPAQFR